MCFAGQVLAEFIHRADETAPTRVKEFVYGLGQLLVERTVPTDEVATHTAAAGFDTGTGYELQLTAGVGASSYSVDIQTRSGFRNQVTGIQPDAQGRYVIDEEDLSPGEVNFVRIRAEGSDEAAYSLPVTIAYDPDVSSGSDNQVRAVSVSRNGQDLVLRWSLHEQNGKDFRVYFEDAETGSIALLTAAGLPGGTSELTLDSQALSEPCGTLSLTQGTAPSFPDETTDSFGREVPGLFHFEVDPIWPCPGREDPPPAPEETFVDRFHHRDHLGSLRVVTDEAGWKIQSGALDFYPFGLQIGSHDGTSRREYTGHERDEETGLDYMMARYKQTCSPRFTSPDPIFDTSLTAPTTWNRYGYVHGDPIGSWDPWGLSDYKETPEAVDIGLVDYLNVTAPAYGHGVFLLGQILAMHAQWASSGKPGIGPRGRIGSRGGSGRTPRVEVAQHPCQYPLMSIEKDRFLSHRGTLDLMPGMLLQGFMDQAHGGPHGEVGAFFGGESGGYARLGPWIASDYYRDEGGWMVQAVALGDPPQGAEIFVHTHVQDWGSFSKGDEYTMRLSAYRGLTHYAVMDSVIVRGRWVGVGDGLEFRCFIW